MINFKATALVIAMSFGGIAYAATPTAAHIGNGAKAPVADLAAKLKVLYDQSANDSGNGYSSQNFEAAYDAYDAQAADDFTVPAGKGWTVSEVDVYGQYSTGGPAASVHITFYSDKKGKPGAVVADIPAAKIMTDNAGSFTLKVPKTKLAPGKYWISAQSNQDFLTAGQWYWESQTTVAGTAPLWQNPGDGFGTGCVKYADENTCLSGAGPADHMFVLKGK